MIRVAFCDDERAVLDELCARMERYRAERDQSVEYVAFRNPLELLAEIEKGVRFDILFLDAVMSEESGMEVASEIRACDDNVKIIFLASSAEFALQSYGVKAFFYQLKPVGEGAFFALLDAALAACEREREHGLILRCKNGITRIDLQKLEYCEVIHRTLFLHLTNGTVLESIGSMDRLYKQLEGRDDFYRPHRSYLVNLAHVQSLNYRAITMSCQIQIPLPRGKYQQIRDAYLDYAVRAGQIVV